MLLRKVALTLNIRITFADFFGKIFLFSLGNPICVWAPELALPQHCCPHLFPHPLEALMTRSLPHLNDPGVSG